jgi:hypothetical protein
MADKKITVFEYRGAAYKPNEKRYAVVDTETGEVLDDAQGYGYKSIQKAYAGYGYKTRDKSKDAEKKAKEAKIRKWMKEHKEFVNMMEQFYFEIECKGSWGPDDKFDSKFVKQMLKENDLEPDFTPGELLKVWCKSA